MDQRAINTINAMLEAESDITMASILYIQHQCELPEKYRVEKTPQDELEMNLSNLRLHHHELSTAHSQFKDARELLLSNHGNNQ